MEMKNVIVIDHPFVQDSLTHLRKKDTELQSWRHHSDKICEQLFSQAMRGLEFTYSTIETPLAKMEAPQLADEIVVIPILRSGIAMLSGAMHLLPKSRIGFIGLERDEETAIADQYYWKLPPIHDNTVVILTDPMLATGGSILYSLRKIAAEKPKEIRVVSVIAAPEGILAIQAEFPDVKIYVGAIDDHLNERAYIVPGLGDYGDRYFGTA